MGRQAIAGLGILLLVLGCSGDDDDGTSAGSPFGGAEATTTTTAGVLEEQDDADVEGSTNADDENPDEAIAEGGGWRIAVLSPRAGMAIESQTSLCLEIDSPTDQEVDLELRLRPGGSFEESVTTPLAATVGDNALPVVLPAPPDGFEPSLKYDVDVEFVADDAPDLTATVLGVTITGDTFDDTVDEVTCD